MVRSFTAALALLLIATGFLPADAPDFTTVLAANSKLNRWLTVQMPEYGGGPSKRYTATAFETSQVLWQKNDQAVYFATARPPTEATQDEVGLLIAARRGASGRWNVMKSIRLEAIGKYARATAEVTSSASIPDYDVPVITITLNQGGRGYVYSESFTYTMRDDQFILHLPNKN
jgi:hypothetical protein